MLSFEVPEFSCKKYAKTNFRDPGATAPCKSLQLETRFAIYTETVIFLQCGDQAEQLAPVALTTS